MDCDIPALIAFARLLLAATVTLLPAAFAQTSSPLDADKGDGVIAAKPQPMHLPDGTTVRVRNAGFITSKNAKAGDPVTFHVAADVKVGDLIAIRKGATAHGRIALAKKNSRMGRAGKLVLEINDIETITGKVIALRAQEKRRGEGYSGKIADNAVGMGLASPFGLGAVAAAPLLLFKGDNAEIQKATTFLAYVDGDWSFEEMELRGLQPPAPPVTGLATIIVLRNEKLGGKAPSIYFGQIEIGKLTNRHYLEAQVPPGEYLIQSPGIKKSVRFKAEAENTYYVRFYPNAFLSAGFLEMMIPVEADDLLAGPNWYPEPKVDLSSADRAKLADATPLPVVAD